MNVLLVDENLYVRVLQNRDIPYNTGLSTSDNQNSKIKQPDTRHITFDNQNTKAVKPKTPPRHSSIKSNCEHTTTDLSAQPPTEGT